MARLEEIELPPLPHPEIVETKFYCDIYQALKFFVPSDTGNVVQGKILGETP